MMRKHSIASVIMIIVFSLVLMGMSGLGTVAPQNGAVSSFHAKVMDTTNNTVEITSVTIDGKTLFQASLGKGKARIPFENISRITIKDKTACVAMKNSQELCSLKINEISKVYGNTSFGTYQIALKDVVWIEISRSQP
ncbi:MAG TPA: hypothetical protein PLE36_07770 [Deltaproteobacteria bacterium]|nr:hypothetical protein [Deltaproteobacteria bacterium]MDI9542980.1 hypothetical protein [Pseudomonadota bacterium]HNR52133.1 hypothetical protein [Deltaproteobacteria bacterium]HOD72621.1 hypothetical protein [Deltaproteobacteria bacterium]HOE72323.1 hypothetical protein [Deltaproteobacteria bacterium]